MGAYSQAILGRDGVLHVSGQMGIDADGNLVGEGDVGAQTARALANIDALVRAAGGTRRDVVKLTAYLVDMSGRAEFAAARREWVREPHPASTLVEVSALAAPGVLVEIDAIAVLGR
ncbi:MAG: reactive intermediate/imine deaminase [Solirubrobacterales bacterium]|nr:reactive intermediate/imine deaminase [Solirubrobacterales bacterium]